jgi:hypothetical protein
MELNGRDAVRSKTVIDNKITEKVNCFNYLENLISYEKEVDIYNKLNDYLKITSFINNMFRPQKTFKKTVQYQQHNTNNTIQYNTIQHNTVALPALLDGSQHWTIKARDARRIAAAEIKYMRQTAGYIRTDYKTNTEIAKELM